MIFGEVSWTHSYDFSVDEEENEGEEREKERERERERGKRTANHVGDDIDLFFLDWLYDCVFAVCVTLTVLEKTTVAYVDVGVLVIDFYAWM